MAKKPERELIVIVNRDLDLRARPAGLMSMAGRDVSRLSALLGASNARLVPHFGISEVHLRIEVTAVAAAPRYTPDLSVYYRVDAPEASLDGLAAELRASPEVECAYIKPPAELAVAPAVPQAEPDRIKASTPSFRHLQAHLKPAPDGVGARQAWKLPGGRGAGVSIIDIEGAWRFSHEDLVQKQRGVWGGSETSDVAWRNHGTAVIGVVGADDNRFGVVGVAPDADVRAVSIFGGLGSAGAIRHAADLLAPGDILLIELQRPGPRFDYEERWDQRGYIPVEWWPDDFDAIRYATARGILVVEAAGNGGEDLDDALYDVAPPDFPPGFRSPFRRGGRDSGAIVVGAGAPPSGNYGPDRSRLDFSNYGYAVDAQGFGREVTTCGYGDLQGGQDENRWYTRQFSGTSSASPIVAGVLACLQGHARALQLPIVTPGRARALLRATGSPQQDAPDRPATQRIGTRPSLSQLLAAAARADSDWVIA